MGGVTPRWAVRPAPGAVRPRLLRGRLSGARLAGQRLPDAVHAPKRRLGHRVPEPQPDGRVHQQRVLTRVSARRGPGAAPRRSSGWRGDGGASTWGRATPIVPLLHLDV